MCDVPMWTSIYLHDPKTEFFFQFAAAYNFLNVTRKLLPLITGIL